MSSGSGQYNASFGTKTKTLKIRLSISNLSMVLKDRVLSTEPVNLPFTPAVTLSLEVKNGENEESLKIFVEPQLKNNSQEDKTIFLKGAGTIDISEKSTHYEDKSYSKYLVKANSSWLRINRYSFLKDLWVKNDSVTVVMDFEEVILCESQQNFIEDDTEEKSPDFLTSLYNRADYKDVKFVIGKQSLMAHRAIITTRSEVFRAMLSHDTKEKADGVIEIKDVNFEVFEPFIKYLYTNQVAEEKMGDEMLQLADKYDVQCLRSKCEKIVSQCIDETNAVGYLIEADTCNFQLLKSRALEVISGQLKKIRETEEFKLLLLHPHLLEAIYDRYLKEGEVMEYRFTSAALQKS